METASCLQRNATCPHSFARARADWHPRAGTAARVIEQRVCAFTNKRHDSPRGLRLYPSITEPGWPNDSANCSTMVGQWQKHFSGPNLRPLISAVFVCVLMWPQDSLLWGDLSRLSLVWGVNISLGFGGGSTYWSSPWAKMTSCFL